MASRSEELFQLTRGTHLITHPSDCVFTDHAVGLTAAGTLRLNALSGHGFDFFRHARWGRA